MDRDFCPRSRRGPVGRRSAAEHRQVRAPRGGGHPPLRSDGGATGQGGCIRGSGLRRSLRRGHRRLLLERRGAPLELLEAPPWPPSGGSDPGSVTLDPLRFEPDRVLVLDQTLLPGEEKWVDVRDAGAMAAAIAR